MNMQTKLAIIAIVVVITLASLAVSQINFNSEDVKLENISLMKLEEMLDMSLAKEDYEFSAKIRDEIKSRKNK